MSSVNQTDSEKKLDMDRVYYRELQRQFVVDMLKNDGDFLLRRGSDGGMVLSVHRQGEILHFKFSERQREYKFDGPSFPTLDALLQYYFKTGKTLTAATGAKLLNPILTEFDLIEPRRVKLEKQLGAGNFGQVWKARLVGGKSGKEKDEPVAVKILTGDCSEKERKECLAEAKIMSLLSHDNVVSIRGVSFATNKDGEPQLQIILEFCNAGSLDKLLEDDKMTDEGKAAGLLDAAKGMQYLHERDIIHRDIASRNCLAQKGPKKTTVKIADFGLSRMAPNNYELAIKRKLPVFSMPPESLETREWTEASDVWSFGILILEMYNKGRNPYEQFFNERKMDVKAVLKYFKEGKRLDPPRGMPSELAEIAKKCLSQSVSQRPDMTVIVDMLRAYCGKRTR